jgi:hypothetical protein
MDDPGCVIRGLITECRNLEMYAWYVPRCRWVDNIKIDLREIGWDGMDWIDLAQDRDRWGGLL